MLFWFAFAAAIAAFLGYMIWVPGRSFSGRLAFLSGEGRALEANLRLHFAAVASREHNLEHPAGLEAAAQAIEKTLAGFGFAGARYASSGS